MQRRAAMERNHDPAAALRVNPMTTLRPQPNECRFQQQRFGTAAVRRGSLGMNFDRGRQNLAAPRCRALFIGQSLQEQLNCLADIGHSLHDRLSLRLATLQFRAPCITPVLILFDYITLKTAIDSQHCRQVRDLTGFSTAAQFTQWVINAIAANTCD